MAKGTAIGTPVTATDRDSGEILTYRLSGSDDDDAKFDIDARTGQLKVKDELDYEMPADVGDVEGDNQYEVTVTVADSSGTISTDTTPAGTAEITVDHHGHQCGRKAGNLHRRDNNSARRGYYGTTHGRRDALHLHSD